MHRLLTLILTALFVAAWLALPPAHAATYTLSDGNSSLTSDSAAGAYGWLVEGVNQLQQQQWWLGTSAGQTSMDTLTLTGSGSPSSASAFFDYVDPAGKFSLTTVYLLQGGQPGSGVANLTEQIRLTNLSKNPVTFRLFLYTDLDLNGTPGGDTVQLIDNRFVVQTDGNNLAKTMVGPDATSSTVAVWPLTLTSLAGAGLLTLNNAAGPLGPDNVTWTLAWDIPLSGRGSFVMSLVHDVSVHTPIPGAALLLGAALLRLAGALRRQAP